MKAAVVEEIVKPLVVHSNWPDPDKKGRWSTP